MESGSKSSNLYRPVGFFFLIIQVISNLSGASPRTSTSPTRNGFMWGPTCAVSGYTKRITIVRIRGMVLGPSALSLPPARPATPRHRFRRKMYRAAVIAVLFVAAAGFATAADAPAPGSSSKPDHAAPIHSPEKSPSSDVPAHSVTPLPPPSPLAPLSPPPSTPLLPRGAPLRRSLLPLQLMLRRATPCSRPPWQQRRARTPTTWMTKSRLTLSLQEVRRTHPLTNSRKRL